MPGAPWAVSKLRGYREHQGRIQRRCKKCAGWFDLVKLAKQADCRFGRLPLCTECASLKRKTLRSCRQTNVERVLKKLGVV